MMERNPLLIWESLKRHQRTELAKLIGKRLDLDYQSVKNWFYQEKIPEDKYLETQRITIDYYKALKKHQKAIQEI